MTVAMPAVDASLLISILNWNGLDDTLACLERLMPGMPTGMQVVVLDNGSMVDPRPALAQRFPAVELVREPVNLGFTGGNNRVMQLALDRGFDAVLLLNNDCLLAADGIAAMQALMASDARIAAVSPLIYNDDAERRPQMVGGWIDWRAHRTVHPSRPDHPVPAGMPVHLVGTALLLRCESLRRIGLLNDHLFAYYEDNDLDARIAAAGLQSRYCSGAIALHRHRRIREMSPMALYLSSRNAWRFWREHTPAAYRKNLTRDLLSQQLLDIARLQAEQASMDRLRAGQASVDRLRAEQASVDRQHAVVDGLWHGLQGRSGPPPVDRAAPVWLRWLALAAPYLLGRLIVEPVAEIRRRLGGGKAATTP